MLKTLWLGAIQLLLRLLSQAKSQFKSRSIANNVEILIPVPSDVDTPSFKAAIGSVSYLPDQNAMRWKMKQVSARNLDHNLVKVLVV